MLTWVSVVAALGSFGASGGGPANVLVVHNAASADSAAVAMHYGEARAIPLGHHCGLEDVDPVADEISSEDYLAGVLPQLNACLAATLEPDGIDYVVLTTDLPYRVALPDDGYWVSLSAMIQVLNATKFADGTSLAGTPQTVYGGDSYPLAWLDNPEYLWFGSQAYELQNPQAIWYTASLRITNQATNPASFRRAAAQNGGGYNLAGNLLIVSRLDGFEAQDGMDLVDRAIAADGAFPEGELLCMEGADYARSARDPECHYVTQRLADAGFDSTWLAPHDAGLAGHHMAAYFTGASNLRGAIDGNTFAPGAVTGNLTSFGAVPQNFGCDEPPACPTDEAQTSVVRFVRAGATGAHGTVAEPKNSVFPNAGTILLYTFGYNLGESWLFNQRYLYWQNLYLGDPLTTPWATRPVVTVEQVAGALQIAATHADGIARLRVFVDGAPALDEEGVAAATVPLTGEPGDVVDVLAIAIAENSAVERPGWPAATQFPETDTQGWTHAALTIAAPEPKPEPQPEPVVEVEADDDLGAGPEPTAPDAESVSQEPEPSPVVADSSGGCSSRAGRSGGWGLLLLLVVVLGARPGRRREVDARF